MTKLVSIIIPCYNNGAFLRDTIASALAQTHPSTEVIVIDDGSTDNSPDILRTFGDRIHWETQPNQGAPAARNRGLELAQGTYIKFLDADDLLLPNCVEHQVSIAEALPSQTKAIVYGNAQRISFSGQRLLPFGNSSPPRPDEDPIAHILSNCPLTSCPLHRKDYLGAIGGFDPTLKKGQEHDLDLRLVLSGVQFIHHNHDVYQYRDSGGTGQRISDQRLSQYGPLGHYHTLQNHQRLIANHTGEPLSFPVRRALARRYWAFGRGILREGYVNDAKQYFAAAKQLNQHLCAVGKAPYPMLVPLLGPVRAEQTMTHLRHLSSWLTRKHG
jgi:glycosyltransferase involved in cell wall biosynthesis